MNNKKKSLHGDLKAVSRWLGFAGAPSQGFEATALFEPATTLCRWLGIAGTPRFREDVIHVESEQRRLLTLLSEKHTSPVRYEFLFANPFSAAFEQRMKDERKSDADVGRVRNLILDLSAQLAQTAPAARAASNEVWVGFHSEPLIWNLIAVDTTAYVGYYVPGQPGHNQPLLPLSFSARQASLCASFLQYYEHLQSRAWQLIAPDNRQNTRRELVREARRHDLAGCRPDDGMPKANFLVIHHQQKEITKVFSNARTCSAEGVGLIVLDEQTRAPVPLAYRPQPKGRSITRQYWSGPRLYDIFVMLDALANAEKDRDAELTDRALRLREQLSKQNVDWLKWFQGDEMQTALDGRLGARSSVYAFHDKAQESLEILKEYISIDDIYWRDLADLMDSVCSRLVASARTYLRDANPKNVVVNYPEILETRDMKTEVRSILLADLRSTDDAGIERLSRELWLRCRQVDLESVSTRSTSYDDFIHLLGSPVLGNAQDAARRLDGLTSTQRDDSLLLWSTVLFRALRSLGRRVYYYYADVKGFSERYIDEDRSHFAGLTKIAIERLRSMPGTDKGRLEQLKRLMDAVIASWASA